MRRAAKIDRNQPELVDLLRQLGATVQPLHTVGGGCPDLLVGWRGQNFLLEVKDGEKPPSQRALTDDQGVWRRQWVGQYAVVECIEDCLSVLSIDTRPENFELVAEAAREVC